MAFAALLITLASVIIAYRFLTRPKNYPPGPTGIPILGNFLQIGNKAHLVFQKWGQIYGKIFSVQMGLQNVIVVDDPKLMKEMFNDPAFNGRPQNELFTGLSQGSYGVISTEGKTWEAQRRFTLKHLRDFGFGKNYMEDLIMDEVKDVLDWFKREEGKSVSVNRKFSLATLNSLWTIASGKRFPQDDPKLTTMMDTATETFNTVSESGVLLFAPWVRYFIPELSGWNFLQKAVKSLVSFQEETVNEHKVSYVDGHIRDFVDHYLSEMKKTTDKDSSFYGEEGYKHIVATVGDLFVAGSETTSATLSWAVLYLTAYPDIQEKLQEEVDSVVGKSRLPSVADRKLMPYTEALIMEIFRKSSIVPIGVFHRAIYEKEFQGYLIPKGTWIIANLYSVHHNKEIWGDPENFRPTRFLSADGKTAKRNEALIPFQIGKRQCLGEPLAKDTLFLFITSIFQRFQLTPDPENPKFDFEPLVGFLLAPKKFQVVMKDRWN